MVISIQAYKKSALIAHGDGFKNCFLSFKRLPGFEKWKYYLAWSLSWSDCPKEREHREKGLVFGARMREERPGMNENS